MPFIRPDEYSTDVATDRDFLVHAMNWFDENENSVPEYWAHLRPTTPLRSVEIIDNAINKIVQDNNATVLSKNRKRKFKSQDLFLIYFAGGWLLVVVSGVYRVQ